MYELPEIFTGKPDDIVDATSKSLEKIFGLKAGTRKNLEFIKNFFEQYADELSAALALLNEEDHSIVIEHLNDAKELFKQAIAEVEKQLGEHNKII